MSNVRNGRQSLPSGLRAAGRSDRWGDAAVDDPRLLDLVCTNNSFAGDTLVVLGDGALVPIAAVQVGDQVLAWISTRARPLLVT